MISGLLTILGIGLLIVIAVAAIAISMLKKGTRFLFKTGHRRFSSSDFRHRGHHRTHGHHSYGHQHYRRKHSSHSGFFSS
ncbi:hypothetical protein [Brevibacillus sp. H7]|jgi:hypothetical protein|uniref:hypothetical protein n=1 Tax=Brevibacillus sp. H7 TaxID=3349138 RepID=UPI0037FDDE79